MFTALEKEVISLLLVSSDESVYTSNEIIETLQEQWQHAVLEKREWTGSGFFADFKIPDTIPALTQFSDFHLDGIAAEVEGFDIQAEFILFVRNGYLSYLEGYSYEPKEHPWKPDSKIKRVYRQY